MNKYLIIQKYSEGRAALMRQDPLRRKSKNKRGTENKGKREYSCGYGAGNAKALYSV